ncbi:MAG: PAS domain S-box protein [Desulfobacula sp.]|nr:PAS domain S-box protein [Desulfobacula sp.]
MQELRFRYVNSEFRRIAGYTKEKLIGMPSLDAR